MLQRGRLYWGSVDKRRPLLIVSADAFNARASHATVIPGSTRLRPAISHVLLGKGEGGVGRPTMLKCEHIQTLHAADIDPAPLGPPLGSRRMREVEVAILVALGIDIEDVG